jgi:tRNA pseudouridine38-40 synthase
VPAHGLSLEEVRYPEPGQLAARAAATRNVRGELLTPSPAVPDSAVT